MCGLGEAWAHLTQAVQTPYGKVPLVAGEKALLRVFMTKVPPTPATRPPVRATFFLDGKRVYQKTIPADSAPVETTAWQGELSDSANAMIPAWVIQPNLEMVIEIDPDGTLDPELSVPTRVPNSGRQKVRVRRSRDVLITVVPLVHTDDSDLLIDFTRALGPSHSVFSDLNYLLPVARLQVQTTEPLYVDTRDGYKLLSRLKKQRLAVAVTRGTGWALHYGSRGGLPDWQSWAESTLSPSQAPVPSRMSSATSSAGSTRLAAVRTISTWGSLDLRGRLGIGDIVCR